MAITHEWRKSEYWNDLDTNGGYFVYTKVYDNTAENIHPNVSNAQRAAGGNFYKKLYWHLTSGTATGVEFGIDKTSESEDYYAVAKGISSDVQTDAKSFQDTYWYMVGELVTALSSGVAASLDADFDAAYGVLPAGKCALLNFTDLDGSGIAPIEVFTVASSASSGITWAGNQAHIKLASGTVETDYPIKTKGVIIGTEASPYTGIDGTVLLMDINTVIHTITFPNTESLSGVITTLNTFLDAYGDHATAIATPSKVTIENNRYYYNNYVQCTGGTARTIIGFSTDASTSTDGTMVSGVLELGTVTTSVASLIVTSSYGTFDDSSYPILTFKAGTIDEHWTLTFDNTVSFTVSGNRKGNVLSGTITTTCQAANQGSNYWRIQPASFNNSFVAGDEIEWDTTSSAPSIWVKRIVPTSCASWGINKSSYWLQADE